MQDLLSFIESGYEVTQEVPIYVDRNALLEYKRLETEISRTADKDTLTLLEAQQDEAKANILASKITVTMQLPSPEKRQEVANIAMSDFGLTGDEPYEPRDEFLEELTTRNIHSAVTGIVGPNGPEDYSELDSFRAFRAALKRVPANWNSLVDCYNEMTASEVLSDMEFRSADLS